MSELIANYNKEFDFYYDINIKINDNDIVSTEYIKDIKIINLFDYAKPENNFESYMKFWDCIMEMNIENLVKIFYCPFPEVGFCCKNEFTDMLTLFNDCVNYVSYYKSELEKIYTESFIADSIFLQYCWYPENPINKPFTDKMDIVKKITKEKAVAMFKKQTKSFIFNNIQNKNISEEIFNELFEKIS